jgi:hypothetical protein
VRDISGVGIIFKLLKRRVYYIHNMTCQSYELEPVILVTRTPFHVTIYTLSQVVMFLTSVRNVSDYPD